MSCSRKLLKSGLFRPEIIVVPQTEQVPQMDDVNILEIPAEEVSLEDLLEWIIICRWIPVESDEESGTDPDLS